jgi:hypothetical protein
MEIADVCWGSFATVQVTNGAELSIEYATTAAPPFRCLTCEAEYKVVRIGHDRPGP